MLLPSLKEGWGLVIGEAGAHRVPTVAYASAGGTRESIAARPLRAAGRTTRPSSRARSATLLSDADRGAASATAPTRCRTRSRGSTRRRRSPGSSPRSWPDVASAWRTRRAPEPAGPARGDGAGDSRRRAGPRQCAATGWCRTPGRSPWARTTRTSALLTTPKAVAAARPTPASTDTPPMINPRTLDSTLSRSGERYHRVSYARWPIPTPRAHDAPATRPRTDEHRRAGHQPGGPDRGLGRRASSPC